MGLTRYKVVSLFSGAMGLDTGLEDTGRFENLAVVEVEPIFCRTIRENRDAGRTFNPFMRIYNDDIRKLDPNKLRADLNLERGELDLLVGGPPCQTFSTSGRRATVQDHRGELIWDFLRFVDAFQPKFFLMENVRGLLSAAVRHRPIKQRPEHGGPPLEQEEEPGSVVKAFARDLSSLGRVRYRMDAFEVNAVNYGAPQLRERAIFIGNRFNSRVDFPDPTHGPRDAGEVVEGTLKPWRTLGDAVRRLRKRPDDVIMDFSPRKKRYLSMVPAGSNWRSLPEPIQRESMGRAWHAKGGRSGWWRRLSFDLPCPTLVTMPNHASTSLCHPVEVRALSLREYAKIQEFPDGWVFCGSPSEQYAQAGNAVPARLGRVAGVVISEALDRLGKRGWRRGASGAPSDYRIIYVQSHIRTRQWYKNGQTLVWADGKSNDKARYASPVTKRRAKKLAVG